MKKIATMLIAVALIFTGCGVNSNEGSTTILKESTINEGSAAFIKESTMLYEQPNGKAIREDIDQGRVVTVIKHLGPWTKITIYTYDAPMDNVGWVKSSVLTTSTEGIKLIEGKLKSEQVLWDGPPPNGKQLTDKVGQIQVYILERDDGWVHGQFAGGLDGWIPNDSIEYIGPTID